MKIGDKRRDDWGATWVIVGLAPIIGEHLLLIERLDGANVRGGTNRGSYPLRVPRQEQIRSDEWVRKFGTVGVAA